MTSRYWKVNVGIKMPCRIEGQFYFADRTLGVVAIDIDEAIAKTKAAHPECRIWSANNHGTIDII